MSSTQATGPDTTVGRRPQFVISDKWIAGGYVTLVSLFYFAFAAYFGIHRSLWYDELFTYYVATLADVPSIWRSLLGGMDNHPPLCYMLCHFSMELFGRSALAERLPSILAFYLTFLGSFYWLRRIHSTLAGIIGSSLLLASPTVLYAVEARSYALTLALGMAGIILWSRLNSGQRAPIWMWVALSLCLGLSVWAHYYGVIFVLAFATAGVVDWIATRRFPMKLLLAGIAGGIIALPILPFALAASRYGKHFWAAPSPYPIFSVRDSIGNFQFECEVLMLAAVCALVFSRWRPVRWFSPSWRDTPTKFSASEIALLICFLFTPVLQWVLARSVTNAYTWRYTIESFAAAIVIAGLFIASACGRNANVALAICIACILQSPNSLQRMILLRDTRAQVMDTVRALDLEMQKSPNPIVAPHGNSYLAYFYYGSERVKKNLVMLSDEEAALRLGKTDNNELALSNLGRFIPLRVEPFAPFVASNPYLRLAVGRYDQETWVVPRLREAGYRLSLPALGTTGIMYECGR